MNPRRLRAYTILLIPTVIWAAAGSVIKYTLSEIPPFTFLTYRFAISACIGALVLFSRKVKLPKDKNTLIMLAINGILGNTVALGLLFWGLNKTTVLDTSIIEATMPIMASVLGYKLLSEHITKQEKLGITIAFVGTIVTVIGPLLEQKLLAKPLSPDRILGNAAILVFVFFDSYAFIIGKRLLKKGVSAYTISHTSFIFSFITILPLAIFFEGSKNIVPAITKLSPMGHLGVLYMAVISGTIAYAMWNMGQKTIEVSEAAVFRYLIPVFSAPIAILWLNELVSIHFVIGALIIAAGVFIAEYKGELSKKTLLHVLGHKR